MRMLNRGVLNVPNVSFVDEDSSVRYLLKLDFTHNGYEYVNLGLPSGLKWATCNVGASSPEEYGLYFAWGETTGYTAEQVTWGVRAFNSASYTASAISTDLTLEQDAAHVNLGGNWRMPTKADYQELLDNCNVVWTDDYNGTGVAGRIFTSKVNGNSVFFPLPVAVVIRPWKAKARAATIGRLLGTRPPARGYWTSISVVRAWTATAGMLGTLCGEYVNNKINYICNKLDENPAFVVYINI